MGFASTFANISHRPYLYSSEVLSLYKVWQSRLQLQVFFAVLFTSHLLAWDSVNMSEAKDLQIGVFIPIGNNGTLSSPRFHTFLMIMIRFLSFYFIHERSQTCVNT